MEETREVRKMVWNGSMFIKKENDLGVKNLITFNKFLIDKKRDRTITEKNAV